MPYTKDNPPATIKNLPKGAQSIWIDTFNAVHKSTGNEEQARRAAWANVKRKYKKSGDEWVKMELGDVISNWNKPIVLAEGFVKISTEDVTDVFIDTNRRVPERDLVIEVRLTSAQKDDDIKAALAFGYVSTMAEQDKYTSVYDLALIPSGKAKSPSGDQKPQETREKMTGAGLEAEIKDSEDLLNLKVKAKKLKLLDKLLEE